MNAALVGLSGVNFAYAANRPVLRGASFALQAGERVALTGSNGAGKTTLLHLMVGLAKPQAGTIEAFGRVRTAESDFLEVRRRAGLLFQDADDQLFCPTVADDIAFGPLNLGKSRADAREVTRHTLDRLGLHGFEDRITYKLSGGEKRLVALAAVLAMEPEVLLLDEPTTALDAETEERLTVILNGLPQAMVVVSHDRAFLARVATRWVKLENGALLDASA